MIDVAISINADDEISAPQPNAITLSSLDIFNYFNVNIF